MRFLHHILCYVTGLVSKQTMHGSASVEEGGGGGVGVGECLVLSTEQYLGILAITKRFKSWHFER